MHDKQSCHSLMPDDLMQAGRRLILSHTQHDALVVGGTYMTLVSASSCQQVDVSMFMSACCQEEVPMTRKMYKIIFM